MKHKHKKWHKKYMSIIKKRAGLSNDEARSCIEAGMADFDYSSDPKDAALDELSYWVR